VKILKNERTGSTIKLEIEVPAIEYQAACEKTLSAAAKEMKIPGFRPGKAPKTLVERSVDKEYIASRAAQNLISDLYPQILQETQINPVDYPNVSIVSSDEGKPFVFSVEVEVYPEVKLGNYKGINVSRLPTAVSEEDIEKVIGSLRDRFARYEDKKDGTAAQGDLLEIDVEAKEGETVFPSLTVNNVKLVLGEGMFAHEFDQQLVGASAGEVRNFSVSFPAGHYLQEAAGKVLDFKVAVKKVSGKENVALDDAFAKQVGRFGTLAELRDQIRANLEIEKKQDSDADLRNKLVEEILKKTKVDAPRAMVNREVEIMLDEMQHSLSRGGLTLEAYLRSLNKDEAQLKDELFASAKSRVEAKIALREIAKAETIKIPGNEIEMELSKMAVNAGKTLPEFKAALHDGGVEFVEDYLLRQKALDFIVKEAKVK
jgi:trigger factor